MQASSPNERRAADGQEGFTLLEVLVAFTISVFMLGAFLQIFSNGLWQARTTDRYSMALLQAESLLAAVGKTTPLSVGAQEGLTADGFRWRLTLQRYEEGENRFDQTPLVPYQLTLTLTWMDGKQERSLALTSLRLAKRF